ncbi:SDR family oxidoreductase [Pelagibius litoralis]|uniref:SDR family oxidoreductase n=1 Tax=Pelagibius litoralis TaxID=374515 RepID=A0A967K7W3_9PROT|nr:SDR family NAD(P)-dependent oxidoreductase [Pelagibius litoralis]NIA70078.1 SDR family oxidoreductase [Pelagibius litoralis]
MQFEGKTAIVTGGGRDIGRACVMRLAAQGARVAINYFSSAEGAKTAVGEIMSVGGEAFALKGDMTDPADVSALVEETQSRFGDKIDILVHVTGGLLARKTILEMDRDHWDRVMALNTTSLFLTAKAVVPRMPAGGSIVALASQAGRDGGGPGAVAYASSKGAVMTMTRALAKELSPAIRVNALCPGMIDTDFHNTFTKPEVRANVAKATPLKREGTSEDCAELVAFLASDQSAFMTGTCIDINGGLLFS